MAPGWGMVLKRCAGEMLLARRMSQPSVGLFENLLGARGTTAGHAEEGVVDHLGNVQVGVGWRGRMSHSRALGSNGATVWEVEDLAQSS